MKLEITRPTSGVQVSGFDKSIVLTMYFILKPFYFFSSGLPQICDFFLILSAGLFLVQRKLTLVVPRSARRWVCIFAATCTYQFFIDFIWYGVTADSGMLIKALQYIFNLIAAMVCFYIVNEEGIEKTRRAICNGCFYSIVITGFSLLMGAGRGYRATGFFNNPNQLGYYAMITLTVAALFPKELSKWKTIVVIIVSLWANLLSLSKASVVGVAGLAICYVLFVSDSKSKKGLLIKLGAIVFVFVLVYLFLYGDTKLFGNNQTLLILRRRILNMSSENDSDLATGRGYARVTEMGIHFLWGMGEGAFQRFYYLPGVEVHSTYVNMLVSYGVIGAVSYLILFSKVLIKRGTTIKNLSCFSGLLLYFFTHNGIRSTLLWILLALILQNNSKDDEII